MKITISIVGAFLLSGIMWRQEGHYIYHRPLSSFSGWGL